LAQAMLSSTPIESPVCAAMAGFDVVVAIDAFLADPLCTTLELPHMTSAERKVAKTEVEQHSNLRCESYGFGTERQLHLFKLSAPKVEEGVTVHNPDVKSLPMHTVNVKNTFIDDWLESEPEPLIFRSLQGPLQLVFAKTSDSQPLRCTSPCCSTSASGELSVKDGSTGDCTPESSCREIEMPFTQGQPVTSVPVRNTFIHFEKAPRDERIAQSMPHGMFKQCLEDEVALGLLCSTLATEANLAQCRTFEPGTLVVVEGLVKLPAFNGLSAVVQNWDEASGRYNILIVPNSVQGVCQQAKVKETNLRFMLPCP